MDKANLVTTASGNFRFSVIATSLESVRLLLSPVGTADSQEASAGGTEMFDPASTLHAAAHIKAPASATP